MMTVRRNAIAIWSTAFLAGSVAAVFPRAARAQGYEGETPPPPPDDEGQSAVPPADALPPSQAPDQNTFQQSLSPYGRWVDTQEYGRVWVPYETDPDWQPYTDGSWVDTEWGWSFAPTVPWGWATFHYGRWGFGSGLGWFWVPGYVWSPAWVSWRYSPGYVCWSPFAPSGFVFGRHWPGWVVLPGNHFTHPIDRFRIPVSHSVAIVRFARPVAAITSRAAIAHYRGNWGNPAVRGGTAARPGVSVRPGTAVRANHGFTRSSTFRSGTTFRGNYNRGGVAFGSNYSRSGVAFRGTPSTVPTRSFFARGPSSGWSGGGARPQFSRAAPAVSHGGFARRR